MGRALWIPQVCRQFGLTVVETDGWQSRGSATFDPQGVIAHWTAGPRTGEMPSLRILRDGRPDLDGPLAQVGLGRSGTVYVIASGRANHAGRGLWMRTLDSNTELLGIEAENSGPGDDWPHVQLAAYDRLEAALLYGIGRDSRYLAGHFEYALPHGRKPDPSTIDMDAQRARVARIRPGGVQAPTPEQETDVRGLDPKDAPRNVAWCMVKANSPEERTLPDLLHAANSVSGPHFLRGMPVVRVDPKAIPADAPGWSICFGFIDRRFESVASVHGWADTTEGVGTATLLTRRLMLGFGK